MSLDYEKLKRKSKGGFKIWILVILVALIELCHCKTINKAQNAQIMHDYPRRHVRLVIRHIPSRGTHHHNPNPENILQKYTRARDRTLVKVIRTKRKKRNREALYIAPTHMRTVRLKSKTGFFLEIHPSGKVGGNTNKTIYTKMELQVISPYVKRIKGVATGKYLAINRKGKVVSKDVSDRESYFFEELSENFYYLYCSIKYPKTDSGLSWYLGLKRNKSKQTQGRVKRASRTLPGDRATHFSIFYEHD